MAAALNDRPCFAKPMTVVISSVFGRREDKITTAEMKQRRTAKAVTGCFGFCFGVKEDSELSWRKRPAPKRPPRIIKAGCKLGDWKIKSAAATSPAMNKPLASGQSFLCIPSTALATTATATRVKPCIAPLSAQLLSTLRVVRRG